MTDSLLKLKLSIVVAILLLLALSIGLWLQTLSCLNILIRLSVHTKLSKYPQQKMRNPSHNKLNVSKSTE